MKIIFTILFGVSLLIALVVTFSGSSEKPKWVLESVRIIEVPDGEYIPSESPARYTTEHSKDNDGKIITTHKGYSKLGELIEVASYKDGYKHGMQKEIYNGSERKSLWYFDTKGGGYITIVYDSENKVSSVICTENFYTEEHEKVCGFNAPFTYSSNNFLGKLEVTMDKGVRTLVRQYYATGALYIEEKYVNGKTYRKEYGDGNLMKEKVSEKTSWFERKFNREGLILEKLVGRPDAGPDEAIVYDHKGKEVAYWNIVKDGDDIKGCSLKRSLASGYPRPSVCP